MAQQRRNWRWGLLTLMFLGIALASVLVSGSQGEYTPVTGAGIVIGFIGAAFCSVKGLQGFSWLPR